VSGTTGWNKKVEEASKICFNKNGTFFHSSNFSIINRDLKVKKFDLKPKTEVAKDIVSAIIEQLGKRK